jgi:hypothetical protein
LHACLYLYVAFIASGGFAFFCYAACRRQQAGGDKKKAASLAEVAFFASLLACLALHFATQKAGEAFVFLLLI